MHDCWTLAIKFCLPGPPITGFRPRKYAKICRLVAAAVAAAVAGGNPGQAQFPELDHNGQGGGNADDDDEGDDAMGVPGADTDDDDLPVGEDDSGDDSDEPLDDIRRQ